MKNKKDVKSIVFWEKESVITIRKPNYNGDIENEDNSAELNENDNTKEEKEDESNDMAVEYSLSDSESIDLLSGSEEKNTPTPKTKKIRSNKYQNK